MAHPFAHIVCTQIFQQVFCSSKENMKRLKGVGDLCMRKLSVLQLSVDIDRNRRSNHPTAGVEIWSGRSRRHESPDIRNGVRTLQRVIALVESNRN